MKKFTIAFLILSSLNSNAQINDQEKCEIIQLIMKDSLILNNVFFDEPGNDNINIIDTTQSFFRNCFVQSIFGKKVSIIQKQSEISTKNKRLMLEINKVVVNSNHMVKAYIFYKSRNFYAIIDFKKSHNRYAPSKYKTGYY